MGPVPSINAKVFDLSAIVIGFLLIDESTPAEQNALGNWFMLIGQVLCTNSAQQQVLNNRSGTSTTSNQHIVHDNGGASNSEEQIEMLNKVIKAMQEEISNLKKGL